MSVQVAIVDDHEAVRLGFAAACEKNDLDLIASAFSPTKSPEMCNGATNIAPSTPALGAESPAPWIPSEFFSY